MRQYKYNPKNQGVGNGYCSIRKVTRGASCDRAQRCADESYLGFCVCSGLTIGAGGAASLANGSMDLGCGDLVINGALNLDSGTLSHVDNVVINGGGVLNGGTGTITMSGNWTNNGGTANPGSSQVTINADATTTRVTVSGDWTFWNSPCRPAVAAS